MATDKGAKNALNLGDLTNNDLRLVAIAWNCLEDSKASNSTFSPSRKLWHKMDRTLRRPSNPLLSIDLDKFTAATGYANPTSARVCFNATKRKLTTFFNTISNAGDATIAPSPKRKGADNTADNSVPAAKKGRTTKKSRAKAKNVKNEDADVQEEADVLEDGEI
ncbi:hypothetical protein PFICI_08433 [Pestalotiopsis fici W106-1]|uniref:Uncharacterized protein n=1 Tax=Pestalotiopsis fici (strain W106-1 / CGMCC3.15140) TaxID=1229662 RepID=W3X4G7_PESFW|nr:uncharacterized protein PFICI_08433 [Pestalotiopsis fici W106-1]ETS80904.1 hypothetical protein PFICI_08433 [Pestalotiopsis fici W106-1]